MEEAGSNIVILTGPESTGKSVLSEKLASKFGVGYTPEYARTYLESICGNYSYTNIESIARWQIEDYLKKAERLSLHFIDTYLIITKIWFIWKYDKYPDELDYYIKKTNQSLYLLCSPDIEWHPDPLRENGGENRLKLFNLYKAELDAFSLNYRIVSGIGVERTEIAINLVKEFLRKGK